MHSVLIDHRGFAHRIESQDCPFLRRMVHHELIGVAPDPLTAQEHGHVLCRSCW